MRTTKKDVFGRMAYMSKVVGVEYSADYVPHYGGWSMWLANSNGREHGELGFDYRKSTAEFMAYMSGVINATLAIKCGNK